MLLPNMNKTLTFLLSLTFLFLLWSLPVAFAGPSEEPYDPKKTFETTYVLGDLSIKTFRPKVEYQYDIGCFKGDTVSRPGDNINGYPYYVPDLAKICSVRHFGSKSAIEITGNGKTIVVGDSTHDYVELFDLREKLGFIIADERVIGNCWPKCSNIYLIYPETLEVFKISTKGDILRKKLIP